MDGLRSTVAKLAALRGQMDHLARSVPGVSPSTTVRLAETAEFGRNPGKLRMLHHVPDSATPAPALVVALHGCTQTAESYNDGSGWSTLAERHGFALLMPEQQSGNNPNLCFNWFEPGHTRRGGGEALSIHQMIKCMIDTHGLDRNRVFVVGLSAGGAMTAAMLAAYPNVFAAGAVIAGLPAGAATNMREAMDVMRAGSERDPQAWGDVVRRASPHVGPWPRLSVWHGDADPIVHPQNAENIVEQWRNLLALGPEPEITRSESGHRRQVWRDATGAEAIESYTVTGMSHGVPIGLNDPAERCGRAGPLHFDVGISSAASIVRFFGIAALVPRQTVANEPEGQRSAGSSYDGHYPTTGRTPADPRDAIAAALRQAGIIHDGADSPHLPGAALDAHRIVAETLRAVGLLKH